MSKKVDTTSIDFISKVIRFHMIREQRKLLEKEEQELRDFFCSFDFGSYLVHAGLSISVTKYSRTSFDKDAFIKKYGEDIYQKYITISVHKKIEVKKIGT